MGARCWGWGIGFVGAASNLTAQLLPSVSSRYPTQLLLGDGVRTLIVGGYTDGENGVSSPSIEIFNAATNELKTLYQVRQTGCCWAGGL